MPDETRNDMVPFEGGAITESRRFRALSASENRVSTRSASELPPELVELLQQTPARLFVGRTGGSYRTATHLALKAAHASALDAVYADLDPVRDWGSEFLSRWDILSTISAAESKRDYLLRPESGRRLSDCSRRLVKKSCPAEADVQFVLGDGLSATAAITQIPRLLPGLIEGCQARGWSVGRPVAVRHCRVGVMNDFGDLLRCRVVALLVGERPGWATADSLSIYFGYAPRTGDTDSRRNLISNIHDRGAAPRTAIPRALDLIAQMLEKQTSGVEIKERLPSLPGPDNRPQPDSRVIEARVERPE